MTALPALEADPEIVSVTIDHPLKGMDDYTDAAANVVQRPGMLDSTAPASEWP